jgi:hypothetical protein
MEKDNQYVPHNGTDTSREAAASMVDHVGRLEGWVLAAIRSAENGLTCDEVEQRCGLTHQCASARVNGLMNKERIVDSKERRLTRSGRRAIVWRVVL